MAVTSTDFQTPATGNGAATQFPFTFACRSTSELAVYVNGTLALSGYSVALNSSDNGGTVTFSSPPANGATILMASLPSFLQPITFLNSGPFNARAVDGALDEAAIRAIYLNGMFNRSFRVPLNETLSVLPAASLRANKYMSFDASGNPVMSPGGAKGDPGSPGEGYPTRTALAARAATNLDDVFLTEAGREGKFVFSNANLSALVTADPQQAVYIAPASDTTGASGAYVRVRDSNHLHIDWFGPHGDGITDDTTAFTALRTLAIALGKSDGGILNFGPEIRLGPKTYLLASSYSCKGHTSIWRGCGAGSRGADYGITNIKMASGATFTVEKYNTENGTVGSTISAYGADDSEFYDICFLGPGKGIGTAPIVKWRATAHARFCRFVSGGSHGLDIEAASGSGGATEGEANSWSMIGGACIANGGSGLCIGTAAAADTNAGFTRGVYFAGNTLYGVNDNSFLGNEIHGHFATNGNGTSGAFRVGQNSARSLFSGYVESGQGLSPMANCALWLGGTYGDGISGGAYLRADLGKLSTNGFGRLTNDGGLYFSGADTFIAGTPGIYRNGTDGLVLVTIAGSNNDFTLYTPAGIAIASVPTGTQNITYTGIVAAAAFKVGANQVVGARVTGWSADTGTVKRTANATYSGTAEAAYTQTTIQTLMNAVRDLSQTVKALKDDLISHGLIGT